MHVNLHKIFSVPAKNCMLYDKGRYHIVWTRNIDLILKKIEKLQGLRVSMQTMKSLYTS